MAGRRRASGGSDPDTLAAILNLGNAHIATGNHTAALPLVQEALDGLCRVRGRAAAAVTNEKTVGRRFARVRAQALAAATTVAKAPVAARRGRRRRCVARGDRRENLHRENLGAFSCHNLGAFSCHSQKHFLWRFILY